MFTGIVERAVPVALADSREGSLRLVLDLMDLALDVRPGDSIAVRGCCLTVEHLDGSLAQFHLMAQTLSLTAFSNLKKGSRINVERSLRVGDRIGGHFLSGHLDGVGKVAAIETLPGQTDLSIALPDGLSNLVVEKGSIGIDGVSLTVARIQGPVVTVCLIPHTLEVTTLGDLAEGDPVHLEMDMIGKWVQRLTDPHRAS